MDTEKDTADVRMVASMLINQWKEYIIRARINTLEGKPARRENRSILDLETVIIKMFGRDAFRASMNM